MDGRRDNRSRPRGKPDVRANRDSLKAAGRRYALSARYRAHDQLRGSILACLDRIWPLALSLLAALLACPATAATGDRERRCLAMIAYAEAASDGPGRHAGRDEGRPQPHRRPALRRRCLRRGAGARPIPARRRAACPAARAAASRNAGASPKRSVPPHVAARLRLVQAWRLAGAAAVWPARDPTGGALYFVNPRLMDPARCPWFARLKRTAVIGEHVFMRHYAQGERPQRRALDCAAGRDGLRQEPPAYGVALGMLQFPLDASCWRVASIRTLATPFSIMPSLRAAALDRSSTRPLA